MERRARGDNTDSDCSSSVIPGLKVRPWDAAGSDVSTYDLDDYYAFSHGDVPNYERPGEQGKRCAKTGASEPEHKDDEQSVKQQTDEQGQGKTH